MGVGWAHQEGHHALYLVVGHFAHGTGADCVAAHNGCPTSHRWPYPRPAAQHRSSCVRTRTQEGVCAKPSSPPAVQRLQVGCWFGVSVAPGRINQSLAPQISGTDGGQVQKVQRYNPKGCCTYLYLFLAWVQKVQKRLVPICTYLYPAHLTAPAAQTIPAASWMAAAVTSAFMAR